jgi:cytochrome c-type biogenesis protein CcmH
VRQHVAAGDSEKEIKAFMVARYGDWILLKPPFKPINYVLWIAPFAFVAFGAVGIFFYFRRRQVDPDPEPLSDTEKSELKAILKGGDRG